MEGSALILKVDADRRPVFLSVNGTCLENNRSLAPEFFEALGKTASLQKKLNKTSKSGIGWFFAFAMFSLLSMLLIIFSDSYFYISSFFVTLCTMVGYFTYFEIGFNIFFIYAGAAVLAIIVLWFLARKRVIPLLLGFALILADSIFMVYLTFESIGDVIIDYAFHAVVIFCVGRLCMARLNLRKQENKLKDFFTRDNYYAEDVA